MVLSTEAHRPFGLSVDAHDSVVQTALARAPSPERARVNFDRLLAVADDPPELLQNLTDDPHTLETLIALLTGSQYLTEILLRNPGYIVLLSQHSGLAQIKSAGWLRGRSAKCDGSMADR